MPPTGVENIMKFSFRVKNPNTTLKNASGYFRKHYNIPKSSSLIQSDPRKESPLETSVNKDLKTSRKTIMVLRRPASTPRKAATVLPHHVSPSPHRT